MLMTPSLCLQMLEKACLMGQHTSRLRLLRGLPNIANVDTIIMMLTVSLRLQMPVKVCPTGQHTTRPGCPEACPTSPMLTSCSTRSPRTMLPMTLRHAAGSMTRPCSSSAAEWPRSTRSRPPRRHLRSPHRTPSKLDACSSDAFDDHVQWQALCSVAYLHVCFFHTLKRQQVL